jgi:hypothetical protein
MFGRTSADEGGELLDAGPEVPLSFDGATELLRAWCEGLRPDPDLTVSVWAPTSSPCGRPEREIFSEADMHEYAESTPARRNRVILPLPNLLPLVPSQTNSGNRSLALAGQPLIRRQRLVAPLLRLAAGNLQARPRQRHCHRLERPKKLAVTVPVSLSGRSLAAMIAAAADRRLQLSFRQLLDEQADLPPHPALQRVAPLLAE